MTPRRRGGALAAVAVTALALLLPAALPPASAAARSPAATAAGARAAVADGVDRPLSPRVAESSGLGLSPRHEGVLWTHDDSGNAPVLYALGPDGQVRGTVRVAGVPNVDWEAMAAYRDSAGRALLAVADIGDNRAVRDRVEVDVVAEPDRLGDSTAAPLLRLRLTYPDGPRDAEALLVDTSRRRVFVVTKGLFSGDVYVVPADVWDGSAPARATARSARLVRVGTVPLGLVTDGAVAPGGAVLLRTYTGVAAFAPFPLERGVPLLDPVATARTPGQRQAEGLALTPDGRSVLLSSEGAGQSVLRVSLPEPVRAALSASAPVGTPSPGTAPTPGTRPGPSPSAPGASSDQSTSPQDASGAGGLPWGAVALAAGVVLLIAVAAGRSRR